MATVGVKGLIITFIVSLFNSYVQTLKKNIKNHKHHQTLSS